MLWLKLKKGKTVYIQHRLQWHNNQKYIIVYTIMEGFLPISWNIFQVFLFSYFLYDLFDWIRGRQMWIVSVFTVNKQVKPHFCSYYIHYKNISILNLNYLVFTVHHKCMRCPKTFVPPLNSFLITVFHEVDGGLFVTGFSGSLLRLSNLLAIKHAGAEAKRRRLRCGCNLHSCSAQFVFFFSLCVFPRAAECAGFMILAWCDNYPLLHLFRWNCLRLELA